MPDREGRVPESLQSVLDASNFLVEGIAGIIAQANDRGLSEDNKIKFIEFVVAVRKLRTKFFDSSIFGEPGWDMLLDLKLAEHTGRRISVSSLAVASGVPPTTALRWIGVLEKRGLIQRTNDDEDRRKVHLTLHPDASAAVDCLLERSLSALFQTFVPE